MCQRVIRWAFSAAAEDSFIADLSVAVNAGQIKTGAPCRSERVAEFALYQLGAIVVKINWRLTPPEQARMLARNQVSVAFLKAEKPEWGAELERLCADSVRLIRLEPPAGRTRRAGG